MSFFKFLILASFVVSSSAFASPACNSSREKIEFTISGLVHDKTVKINFFGVAGFNLELLSKSQNSMVLMLDGRKAYSLDAAQGRVYSQKSALGANMFNCKETPEACAKVRGEIVMQLENILEKVDQTNTQARNAAICALGIANSL
ncbi:hypothetical protein [Pseudobdellovibrio sp. HCB154]|uniref:hypothetical protein n=1 Tax=Pseudobdellovibrio sp. HCB154 TaxID=3386277 RepID=UPI003916F915